MTTDTATYPRGTIRYRMAYNYGRSIVRGHRYRSMAYAIIVARHGHRMAAYRAVRIHVRRTR